MPFRFDAKNVFLTYPNSCALTKERLRDFLVEELGARWFHIALESHSDGRPHIHAYAGWDGRLRTRNERHFDCDGKHPNITVPRNIGDVRRYVSKDGDVLTNCDTEDFTRDSGSDSKWGELLQLPTKRAFMDGVASVDPRSYILQHERLEYFCDKRYGRAMDEYVGRGRELFREPDELTRWVTQEWTVRRYPLMPILAFILLRIGGAPVPSLFTN